MDNDQTSDMGPEQLARLFGITLDTLSNETDETAADTSAQLLEARLAGVLALDTTVLHNLPAVIAQLDKDIFTGPGLPLGRVLTDPKSDIQTIKNIKRYAKNISSNKNHQAQHTVAIAVYYAAIANALLFHNAKITTHSDEALKAQFKKLSDKPWMSKDLAHLFTKAAKQINTQLD